MITVLKETPITVDGHNCMEQLVHDENMAYEFVCTNCCYREWNDRQEMFADCCTVHGCTTDPFTYFRITEL